jgi:hypothetical protein
MPFPNFPQCEIPARNAANHAGRHQCAGTKNRIIEILSRARLRILSSQTSFCKHFTVALQAIFFVFAVLVITHVGTLLHRNVHAANSFYLVLKFVRFPARRKIFW